MIKNRYLGLSAMTLLLSGCFDNEPEQVFAEPIPDKVDFNFDVKPILSDTCFLCHGPDKVNAKAGLSLDTFEHATSHITDNKMAAITPGDADQSEIYHRIISEDDNFVMPPPSSNLKLSPRDKAIIKKWIEQGAEYKKHWAFIKPEKTELPEVKNAAWVKSPIDAYVLDKIEKRGYEPAQRADKVSLIRRLSFDLTGLPPTEKEVADFLADQSDSAWHQLINYYMAKPAYGERMAQEWLDVARFADTHGYSTDFYRDMSPYRDWVIDSFNQNRPFDQFISWQIAGDLMPNPSTEQRLATAFNRVHAQNGEGGIVNEEFRVEYVKDRVQTLGTGLMGLTMHCAQCHDHKYDPISAKEYYQTTAFFNNLDESGQISYDPNDMPVPTMLLPSAEEKAQLTKLTTEIKSLENRLQAIKQTANDAFNQWKGSFSIAAAKTSAQQHLIADYPLTLEDNNEAIKNRLNGEAQGKVIYGSNVKKKDGPAMQYYQQDSRQAIKLNGDDPLYFQHLNDFRRGIPFAVTIDAWLPESAQEGVLFHYNKAGILYNFKGFDVGIEHGHWHVRLAHTYPYNAISLKSVAPVQKEQWLNVAFSYDGSSKASGVDFYVNGHAVEMQVERDNLYKEIKHTKAQVLEEIGLKVGARWRSRGIAGAIVDNLKVYNSQLSRVELMATSDLQTAKLSEELLLEHYLLRHHKAYQSELAALAARRDDLNQQQEAVKEVMVMEEMKTPRQAYILLRGSYASHGDPVEPGVPEAVLPYDPSWPKNRLGLAKWLTHKDNPLVSRVLVNRYWQMFFGDGIVRTPEDFGNQGKRPTHPALLDWLAVEFVESGWNLNHLVKLMLHSSTYQQSSKATTELLQKDPENTLFARASAQRLTAEMLRDNVLAVSGLLVDKIGGKSTHPYQPDGIWSMNNMEYKQGSGEDLYRRSMYTIYKRSTPPPNMTNFDASMRGHSIGQRQETNTPLQSLTLLNDPQVVEASRVLAEKMMQKRPKVEDQLAGVFKALTSREVTAEQLQILHQMYQRVVVDFKQDPSKAEAFLNVGEMPVNSDLPAVELAALGTVSNMLVSHDAAVIKR
ncbi:DUF1553 domain-containing protein [Gayadomonas joobiniege]|uniref:DUF1553 domain-containing protein n=1 Tax=Gayadomonas joobiniege TaxID=1234606 RepID=UPI00035C0B11|nr:DUF1553 domain-containing protein [Gayadomonas joobiniege]